MKRVIETAFGLNYFIKFKYLLPSNHTVTIIATPIECKDTTFKALIFDQNEKDLSAATYHYHRVIDTAIMPYFRNNNTVTLDQKHLFITHLNIVRLFTGPLVIKQRFDALPGLKTLLKYQKLTQQVHVVLQSELAIKHGNHWVPVIVSNITYSSQQSTMTSKPFMTPTIQLGSLKLNPEHDLALDYNQLMTLYQKAPEEAYELLCSFYRKEDISMKPFYIVGAFETRYQPLHIDDINKHQHHPIQLLFRGLTKSNLGKKTYHLPLRKTYFDYYPTLHTSFKHFYSELIIDDNFDYLTYLLGLIETAILNDEKLLIVVDNEQSIKDFNEATKNHVYQPLMISQNQILNDTLGYDFENANAGNIPKTHSMLKIANDMALFNHQYRFLEQFKNHAKAQQHFTLNIAVETLIDELIHNHQTLLPLKIISAMNHAKTDQFLHDTLNQHFQRIHTAPYKPIKTLIKNNNKQGLLNALKDKRLNQLIFSLFKQVIITSDELNTINHASDFHTVVALGAERMNPFIGAKLLSKSEHFTAVINREKQEKILPSEALFNLSVPDFISMIQKKNPYYPSHLMAPLRLDDETMNIIDLPLQSEDNPHTSKANIQWLKMHLRKGSFVLTPFNEDLKKLKKTLDTKAIHMQSVHKSYKSDMSDNVYFNIPIHQNTSISTFDWLKNHPSITAFFKRYAHTKVHVLIQRDALKQLSNQKDMLYYYLVKEIKKNHTKDEGSLIAFLSQDLLHYEIKKKPKGELLTLNSNQGQFKITNYKSSNDVLTYDKTTFDLIKWFIKNR